MSPRGRFRRRLTIAVLAVAMAPALTIGIGFIASDHDALEEANRERLNAVVDDVGHQVNATFEATSVGLGTIAQALTNTERTGAERMATVKQLVAALPGIALVGIYDQSGARLEVARRAGDATALPDQLPAALMQEALATSRAFGATVKGTIPLVQPVRFPDMTWFAYVPVSLAPLDASLAELTRDRFDGDPDGVFVVDREMRIVGHADPEQVMTDVPMLAHFGTVPKGERFAEVSTYDTSRGEMVGAVRSLSTVPFEVVAQVPYAKAFGSLIRMKRVVIAVVALAIALAALVAFVLARRVSAPIARLVALSRALAARRFTAKSEVHTGDELEVLGDAMMDAGRQLASGEAKLLEEAAIRADLGRYLPNQLVDKVVQRAQSLELGGHRRTVSVLFADVASFTTLTEGQPPEVVVTILNQLFTILTDIVFRHGGTIDKFIGDAVMAFWNAPDEQADHAARAVAAASDMLRWLELCNETWQAKFGVTIHLAIGVNTGEVVVGNFGSATRMTYTCIGDPVNVAARLESIARPQQILISRRTREEAASAFDYVAVGQQRLPGRLEPIEAFEVSV